MPKPPGKLKKAANAAAKPPMHPDRKVILVLVLALAAGFTGVTVVLRSWLPGVGGLSLLLDYVWTVLFSFMTAGLAAFRYNRKMGLFPTRQLLRWFVVASLFMTVFFVMVLFLQYERGWFGGPPDPGADSPFAATGAMIGVPIVIFFVFFGVLVFFMMTGFGVISVMVALERRLAPAALVRIRRLSRATSDDAREKDPARYYKYRALAWIFNIPDVLETGELRLGKPAPSKRFPWPAYWRAMGWSVLFGTVITIDISFSPFLLESFSIQQLISVTSMVSMFIPWLVLPWFIFRRLGAGIPGPSRTFLIYNGLRSRVFGSLVAIGTLLTLIRLALRDMEPITILYLFFSYYSSFLLVLGVFAFVYFNYFEDGLADDVAKRYDRLQEKEEGGRKDEEV
jgi:hypothetical protein